MRLSHRHVNRETRLELQLTPMIDVVFQLLIFFLVTLSLSQTERNLDSGIRTATAASRTSELEPAVVEIVRSGERFVFRVGARELTDLAELTELLEQFPNKVETGAFVRVPDEAPYERAATAIQAAKSAGFIGVSYVPLE
jgi:biopolymer transport protein ExbD